MIERDKGAEKRMMPSLRERDRKEKLSDVSVCGKIDILY
jgi:hypothetical protein